MGHSTVNVIFRETCEAIWETLQPEFLAIPTQQQWKTIADEFWQLWNYPLCVGAIDGKHILIKVMNIRSMKHNSLNPMILLIGAK